MKEWFTTKMRNKTDIKISFVGSDWKVAGQVNSVGDDYVVVVSRRNNATHVCNFAHIMFAEDDY